jgi:chromosome segregation ATPase
MRTRILALSAVALLAAVSLMASERFSYVYKRGQQSHIRSTGEKIATVVRKAKQWSGELVWARRNGREYLIRDAATLVEVRGAFAELDAMEPTMREAERRMRPYEERMEVAERRVDAIGDQLDDDDLTDATRAALERKLESAERDMEAIEREMAKVERAMEDVENEMERREEIAERRFEQIVIRAIESGRAERVD